MKERVYAWNAFAGLHALRGAAEGSHRSWANR